MKETATAGRVLRAAGLIGGSSMVVTALGFLKNLLAAYYFGTSREMDTYLLALVIPDMVQMLSMTGLFNYIPLFAEAQAEHGEKEAWRVGGTLLTFWLFILALALLVCFIAAGWLSWVVAPGLDAGPRASYVVQTRVLMIMALGMGGARILSAAHNARKRFLIPSLAEVVFQVSSIGYLVVFHVQGSVALVGGMVFGGFCQLLVSAWGLRRDRVEVPARLEPRHPAVRKMIRLTLPSYVGNAGAKINQLVNAAFASTLTAGAFSSLQYAYMMVDILANTLGSSLGRALFPFLAEQFAENRRDDITRTIDRAVVATAMVTMPAAAGLFLLAHPVVTLLLQRGSFDVRSTELTTVALQIYAPLLFSLGVNHILLTIFYAQKNPGTPVRLGLIRVALTAALCATLVHHLGHRGIALASTIGEFVKLGLMMAAIRQPEQRAGIALATRSMVRVAGAVAVMCAVLWPLSRMAAFQTLGRGAPGALRLAALVLAGGIVYTLALRFVCPAQFAYFREQVLRLVPRRRPAGAVP